MAPSSELACNNEMRFAHLGCRNSSSILEATSFSDGLLEVIALSNSSFKDHLACNNEMQFYAQLPKSGTKVLHFFELSKFFTKKSVFFAKKLHIC